MEYLRGGQGVLYVPRQQRLEILDALGIGNLLEQVREVGMRLRRLTSEVRFGIVSPRVRNVLGRLARLPRPA